MRHSPRKLTVDRVVDSPVDVSVVSSKGQDEVAPFGVFLNGPNVKRLPEDGRIVVDVLDEDLQKTFNDNT
jgi:hypothetical protein